jgi:xanthine dehydrogenase accessory factor
LEIFMEPVLPAPLVLVLGDSPIAQALNAIGSTLGYEVAPWVAGPLTSVDAVILASHGDEEEAAIIAALKANVPYVGLVASPKRASAVLDSLDVTPDMRARVHAPAGLNIGAQTPEEIALSIFAEIIEDRRAPKRIRELPLPGAGKEDVVIAGESALASDPICNMVVAAVDSSIHADHDGSRWYFCCLGCKEKFLSDPAKFAGVA